MYTIQTCIVIYCISTSKRCPWKHKYMTEISLVPQPVIRGNSGRQQV